MRQTPLITEYIASPGRSSSSRYIARGTDRGALFAWVGGGESPALAQALAVLHGRCAGVAQVHPTTSRLVPEATGSTDVARVVKRRRYLIERAREAKVVGIVAGTLGVAGYLTAIERLRRVIAASGRKSYTVVAGKPNPQKLANFPEIEAFVLVACEQAALIDGRDYLQAVITPWEAEVAFTHGKVWDGEVRLDFEHLLGDDPEVHKRGHDGSGAGDDAGPEFSFLGGGVRARAADAGDGSDLHGPGVPGVPRVPRVPTPTPTTRSSVTGARRWRFERSAR